MPSDLESIASEQPGVLVRQFEFVMTATDHTLAAAFM